jgi:HAD superfamily hydrolase (TIGR01509 family)
MKDIKLAIFDMDGLMFDTEVISLNSWLKVSQVHGYDLSKDVILELVGRNKIDGGKVMRNHLGQEFPYEKIYDDRVIDSEEFVLNNGVPIKEGLLELLDTLDNMGIKKAVATSTSRNRAEVILGKAGVLQRFDTIVCGDEIKRGKPDPDIFLKACGKIGVEPGSAIVLEDSEMGLIAANRAGIKCILIPDIKEPSQENEKLAYKRVKSLLNVIEMLQDNE